MRKVLGEDEVPLGKHIRTLVVKPWLYLERNSNWCKQKVNKKIIWGDSQKRYKQHSESLLVYRRVR